MLLTSSMRISPNVVQASLGDSMRWIIEGDRSVVFIDGCSQDSIPLFESRIERLISSGALNLSGKTLFRMFTADDKERAYFPDSIGRSAKAIIGDRNRKHSPPGVVELCAASSTLDLGGDVTIRRMELGLANPASTAFLIEPDGILVADISLGFFRGRHSPAPGASLGLKRSVQALRDLAKIELAAIGLPWGGALTGALGVKHISDVAQVTEDLVTDFTAQFAQDASGCKAKLAASRKDILTELTAELYSLPEDYEGGSSDLQKVALAKACEDVLDGLISDQSIGARGGLSPEASA